MGTQLIRNCDIFINIFEKHVAEAQKKIENLRNLEQIYNVARSGVLKFKGSNEIDVSIADRIVSVSMTGLISDSSKSCQPLVNLIAEEIDKMPFLKRVTNKPPVSMVNGYSVGCVISFHNPSDASKPLSLSINMSVPSEGMTDLVWKERIEHTSYPVRTLCIRDNPVTIIRGVINDFPL